MYKIMHIEARANPEKIVIEPETKPRNLLEAWANREKFPLELRANSEKITPTIERTENEVRERTHFKLLELASVEKIYTP